MNTPLYKNGAFWVRRENVRGEPVFYVFRDGTTAATRVATIGDGPAPSLGIQRAIAECDRRAGNERKAP